MGGAEHTGEPDPLALTLLRVGWQKIPSGKREAAKSLVAWYDKNGFLTEKQWKYAKSLAAWLNPEDFVPDFTQGMAAELEELAKV
jgi:hypothetical protein